VGTARVVAVLACSLLPRAAWAADTASEKAAGDEPPSKRVALTSPAPKRGPRFEVQSETVGQAYDVASPWGDVILERRRFLQTLGLGVYHLQGDHTPTSADFNFVMRLRLDADFGINGRMPASQAGGETRFDVANGARYVPGLAIAPLDLMYGYLEGKNLAKGWLGFRLGRQYVTDALGWWSFDGAMLRVTTPYYLQLEAYGGLEQRGGLPLSTARFERQGVWRGSRDGFGASRFDVIDYPSFVQASPAPAFGVALETSGFQYLHGRVSYRRVYNTGSAITQQFPDQAPGVQPGYPTIDGVRVSSERLGYALHASKPDLGGVKGGFAYDLYVNATSSIFAGLEAYLGKHVTVGADFDYFLPTFDADSIWNWFTKSPVMSATGRFAVSHGKRWDVSGSGGVRMWTTDGDPATFGKEQCRAGGLTEQQCFEQGYVVSPGGYGLTDAARPDTMVLDALASLAARYRFQTAEVSGRAQLQAGDRGRRVGGDVSGEKNLDGGRFALGGMVSVYDWHDPVRVDRSATSFGYMVAGAFRPLPEGAPFRPDLRLEWQHDVNRLVGHRFRVVGLLRVWAGHVL
jgi:hypothetical protein